MTGPTTPREKYIEERLQEAARTLRRLPDTHKPQGYFNLWPPLMREPLELLQMEKPPIKLMPLGDQIDRMEEVLFVWLPPLTPEERKLLWLRAERVRWKVICARFGVGRTKAWEMYKGTLAKLAARL